MFILEILDNIFMENNMKPNGLILISTYIYDYRGLVFYDRKGYHLSSILHTKVCLGRLDMGQHELLN